MIVALRCDIGPYVSVKDFRPAAFKPNGFRAVVFYLYGEAEVVNVNFRLLAAQGHVARKTGAIPLVRRKSAENAWFFQETLVSLGSARSNTRCAPFVSGDFGFQGPAAASVTRIARAEAVASSEELTLPTKPAFPSITCSPSSAENQRQGG